MVSWKYGASKIAECYINGFAMEGDNPTMTSRADSKKRIVLPAAKPGDVFEIQDHGNGRFTVVRLVRPEPKTPMTRVQCLKAIASSPLRPKMDWQELKKLTREP